MKKSIYIYLHILMIATIIQIDAMEKKALATSIELYKNDHVLDVQKILSENANALNYSADTFQADTESEDCTTMVLKENNAAVGIIQYFIDKDFFYLLNNKKRGYIRLLAVDENHRKKGYGTQLLKHALQDLENAKVSFIYLDVFQNNKPAQKLYQSLEFSSDPNQIPFIDIDYYFFSQKNGYKIYYKNYQNSIIKNKNRCALLTLTACCTALFSTYLLCMLPESI